MTHPRSLLAALAAAGPLAATGLLAAASDAHNWPPGHK